jgi:hypothetical protein
VSWSERPNLRSLTTTSVLLTCGSLRPDIGEPDAATPLMPVYPNWFVDQMADQPLTHALEADLR